MASRKPISDFPTSDLNTNSYIVTIDPSESDYKTSKHQIKEVSNKILNNFDYLDLYTENKTIIGSLNELNTIEKNNTLMGKLLAGQTSLTFVNEKIMSDSLFDIYTDIYGINPTDIVSTNGTITLTFTPLQQDLNVKIIIRSEKPLVNFEDITTIYSNSTGTSVENVNFSEDYHNFDLLEIQLYDPNDHTYNSIYTLPEMIDKAALDNQQILLYRVNINRYTRFYITSNTLWTYRDGGQIYIYKINGRNCNYNLYKEVIFNNPNFENTPSNPLIFDKNLSEYNYIFILTSRYRTATTPCYYPYNTLNYKGISSIGTSWWQGSGLSILEQNKMYFPNWVNHIIGVKIGEPK